MSTTARSNERPLLEQLVQLTEAVKQLAEQSAPQQPGQVSDDDRIRQRVVFGYQALGTLTGRVSTASGDEFDVRVVGARREDDLIRFRALPPGADWVELRSGTKVELLRIEPDRGNDDVPQDAADSDGKDGAKDGDKDADKDADKGSGQDVRGRRRRRGLVRPEDFAGTDPIGSIVFLRSPQGPLVAFGPRLDPVLPTHFHRSDRVT